MSPAPKKNKFAGKKEEDLSILIPAYIKHRSEGYSKESFIGCDYRTIESHLENDEVLQPLKKELEKAEREGLKYWEELGQKLIKGELKGNPATWIFTMKNKYPSHWKDKTEQDVKIDEQISKVEVIIRRGKNNTD